MRMFKSWATAAFILFASQACLLAQYELALSFRGMACSTNSSGQVVRRTITEQTLLADAAAAGGITDLSSIAVVYHEQGPAFGSSSSDSIDVIYAFTGAVDGTLYGFLFGDTASLNRVAITNGLNTEVRRVDYVYTSQSSHSMGAAFVTKRFLYDGSGHIRALIEGRMQWIVNPVPTNGTQVGRAAFTTKKVRF